MICSIAFGRSQIVRFAEARRSLDSLHIVRDASVQSAVGTTLQVRPIEAFSQSPPDGARICAGVLAALLRVKPKADMPRPGGGICVSKWHAMQSQVI